MKSLKQKNKATNDNLILLGLQSLFACFGATVLVPTLTGLSVSSALFFAGIGTILFHFLTKKQVPIFLGSSFAFIAGYQAIAPNGEKELLPYACIGVMTAGVIYLIFAGLFKLFGTEKIIRFFPTTVTAPIVIAIGLTLAGSAVSNCATNWWIALLAIIVVIIFNLYGKGIFKIVPILMGLIISYAVALITDSGARELLFTSVAQAKWIGLPFQMNNTVFSLIGHTNKTLLISAIITIMPIAIASCSEHLADISAISSTCRRDFIGEIGFHRTLLGDGLSTILSAMFGAPSTTTYSENTAVVALTGKTNPKIQRIAGLFAILFGCCPKFAMIIECMPTAVIGGISLVLYGMISSVGVRNLIEEQIDFKHPRNIIITALILSLSIGITYGIGSITIGIVTLSGLAVATLVGVFMNAIIPVDNLKI